MKHYSLLVMIIAGCLGFSHGALAADKVRVTYTDNAAIVDYSGLVDAGVDDITRIRYHKCADQIQSLAGVDTCRPSGPVTEVLPTEDNKLQINDIGLFSVDIWRDIPLPMGETFRTVVAWKQFVVNLYKPDAALQTAIGAHSPLYSFFTDENYKPVRIDEIYGRPLTDFTVGASPFENRQAQFQSFRDSSAGSAADYMRGNGSYSARIALKKEVAKTIGFNPSDDTFPVYWMADKIDETTVRVHYFVLFGFDEKVPAYVGDNAEFGEHAIDRESVTITFKLSGSEWSPTDITYAAHLPSQTMSFFGCADDPECKDKMSGTKLADWNLGATTINWNKASRLKNRPIVYVAHGSHAHFPARGFYDVDLLNINLVDAEPAGELDPTDPKYYDPDLTMLDLNNSQHAALTFSGTVINGALDGLLGRYRQFPFVRYPTNQWHSVLGDDIEQCVDDEDRNCEDYMLPQKECYGIGGLENADGISFDDRDNDGVQDSRDAFPDNALETTDIDNNGLGDNANPPVGFVGITGQVKDENDLPVPDAYIRLEMLQQQSGRAIALQTKTNEDGFYRLPVDLVSLPDTFAVTYISRESLSRTVLLRNDNRTEDFLADVVLSDCDASIVQIERFPRLHHAGDDSFEGLSNSQFQRETEAQLFTYGFNLPEDIGNFSDFEIKFFVKGVNDSRSTFQINGATTILIPSAGDEASFLELSFAGKTSDYSLVPGENTLAITAGWNGFDFDDFEFVNPVISFF